MLYSHYQLTLSLPSNAMDGHYVLRNGYLDHDAGQVKILSRHSSKRVSILFAKVLPKGDFRLSYFNAETLLIGNLSDLQFKAYRAFKSFISHYKKSWSPNAKKAVCSYHLKTIVLWYCEKTDPIDWTEDRIVAHLLSLIDDLILAINEKNLPMYFMPTYNLMERLKDKIEAVDQIRELRLNLKVPINPKWVFDDSDGA